MRLAQVTINQLKFQMANRLKTRLLTDVIAKFHTECNMGDFFIEQYTPMAYRKLKAEVDSLREENKYLKNEIKKITSQMLVIVREEL